MNAEQQKPKGLTKNTGWQVGLRRTIGHPHQKVWELMTSYAGVSIWLGLGEPFKMEKGAFYNLQDGTSGEIRVVKPSSHLRITRYPQDPNYDRASTIQIRVIKKDTISVLVFHEEHLPSQEERQARKIFFLSAAEQILILLQRNH